MKLLRSEKAKELITGKAEKRLRCQGRGWEKEAYTSGDTSGERAETGETRPSGD